MKPRKQSEAQLQAAVMQYLKYFYPKALAIHVPNEGKRNPRYVKASGITAGVSDVLIFDARLKDNGMFVGCGIELKLKGKEPTDKQKEFINALKDRGWHATVCYSFDEAKEIIDWYLKK